jgi:CelD/BcsL family acetyltransferase involved in cellulose biosynthesis
LTVTCVQQEAQLAPLAEAWNRLADGVPFRRWEWLATWWRHFQTSSQRLFVLVVHDADDRVVAIAPWYIQRTPGRGRVVRFLGSGVVCSDYLTIMAQKEVASAAIDALADYLVNDARREWHALEFTGVRRQDPHIEHLSKRLAGAHCKNHQQDDLSCWRLELPESWDAYLKLLSKSRRERVRKLWRRQFETGQAVLHCATTEATLQQGWEILTDLHQRRRNSLKQSGCFSSPRFTSFLRDAAQQFFDQGALKLQWIELDQRPVAVEFDIVGKDTIYYYQSGIEPNVMQDRPGWLGTIAALRGAIEEGFQHFDFLRGDEAYKAHWRATAQPLVRWRIAGPGRMARARHAIWLQWQYVKDQLRPWVRRLGLRDAEQETVAQTGSPEVKDTARETAPTSKSESGDASKKGNTTTRDNTAKRDKTSAKGQVPVANKPTMNKLGPRNAQSQKLRPRKPLSQEPTSRKPPVADVPPTEVTPTETPLNESSIPVDRYTDFQSTDSRTTDSHSTDGPLTETRETGAPLPDIALPDTPITTTSS